ncbi:MAG: protein of unknown function rane [Mucilaginibacter sp.]|nr:protein of unknown function rane [Mucilaginibacter sp.]
MVLAIRSNTWHWWMFLLRGLLFILLGIYMLSAPLTSYVALSFLFGIIILLAGITELLYAYANRHTGGWGWRFLLGIIDLVLGIILVTDVSVSMSVLPFLVGIWFLFKGFSLLGFASLLHRPFWMIAGGILMILFALLIIFNPAIGAMTIVLWTAFAFIITGIFNSLLAFSLRSAHI